MKTNLITCAFCTVTLLGLTHVAHAQNVYIITDTTLDSSNPAAGNAFIGRDSTDTVQTSPTVALVVGGSVGRNVNLVNSSTFNMSGGSVGFNVSGNNTSVINLSGGSISSDLILNDSATATVSGGTIALDVRGFGSGTLNINAGTINGDVSATAGTTNITGGTIGGTISSTSSGSAPSGHISSTSGTVNISGGSISNALGANGSSTFNVSGGGYSNSVLGVLADNSTFNIFGTGLSDTLTNPNDNGFSDYMLSGFLSSGFNITGKILEVQNGSTAIFTLNNSAAVPEPGSIALLVGMASMGGMILRRRNRC